MCGISAILRGPQDERAAGAIRAMTQALRHRGPDMQSYRAVAGAQLGHARLSIIDLAGGDQPMSDAVQRHWIVFNGELYNYRELRAELMRLGCHFHSRSDTEVILAAYLAWGARCLDRFRGMYAFLIWDTQEQRAFAARDIFGEKPLYYAVTPQGALVVASEIKSMIESRLLQRRLDPAAVDAYLCLGYMPPDRTIYENIRTLPPGHYMTWRADAPPQLSRYWKPVFDPRPVGMEEAGEKLRALLQQAVRRQMVADVPVGAFLSGGHDSSTVVALMAEQTQRPVQTFSVGFGGWINELPYAQAVSDRYRTQHHAVDLGTPDVAELLERMAEVYDEPFLDPSHIPTYLISEYARRHVKVVLTGDGADELFGGYAWYTLLADSTRAPALPLAWLVSRVASRLLRDRIGRLARYSQARRLARRWPDPWERYVQYRAGFSPAERAELRGAAGDRAMTSLASDYYRPGAEVQGMNRVLYFDLMAFLPGDILVKVDRAAMAHGLETRAPFLDRDLVEFALTLPSEMKVTAAATKVLYKSALQHLWPKALHRRGKQGFAAPYEAWLARDDVRSLIRRVFARGSPLHELVPGMAPRIAAECSYRTWSLLTLGLWLERHTDAMPSRGETQVFPLAQQTRALA